MANEDVEAAYRPRPVWPRAVIFAFSIFAVIGAFWAIVSLVRTYVEPPRVGGPARMTLAARETQPAPPPAAAPEPAPAVAQPGVAPAAPPSEPPADPIMPYQVTALDQPAAVEEPPSAPGLVASRWLPVAAPAAATVAPQEPPKAPEPVIDSMPASENGVAGPIPIPRPKPRVAASTAATDPPLPRPRPNGSAPASLLTPIPSDDDRFGTQ